jgi:hypothetical protein
VAVSATGPEAGDIDVIDMAVINPSTNTVA